MAQFLIDSGALLALVDASDQHHPAAAAFLQSNLDATFFVVDTVSAETMVLTKARLGSRPAVELGSRIRSSARFPIVVQAPEDREATSHIFSRYLDKDWSYVDCSILAAAWRLNFTHVFAFDRHFDQTSEMVRVPD